MGRAIEPTALEIEADGGKRAAAEVPLCGRRKMRPCTIGARGHSRGFADDRNETASHYRKDRLEARTCQARLIVIEERVVGSRTRIERGRSFARNCEQPLEV